MTYIWVAIIALVSLVALVFAIAVLGLIGRLGLKLIETRAGLLGLISLWFATGVWFGGSFYNAYRDAPVAVYCGVGGFVLGVVAFFVTGLVLEICESMLDDTTDYIKSRKAERQYRQQLVLVKNDDAEGKVA